VIGLLALAALHWRRAHPAAVGLFTAAASMVVIAASGAALVATFNAAVRARGLHLAYVVVLSVASCFTIPLLYPGGNGYWVAAGIGLLCTGYALSKRLQRWRSIVAWSSGQAGSFNVAPPTWTKSVTKNRLLAAGYYGARRVGMEVFAADTMRTLMAALMVHDLHALPDTRSQADTHPEERIGSGAVHGGYWRRPYDLHSTLVYTGLLGLPEAYVPKLR